MEHLEITLTIELKTAFHSTGNLRRWGADKAQTRDATGRLVIPATTIKGFLREKAELLLRTWGLPVCVGPDPGTMCEGQSPCLVCRVFGNPRLAAPLRFADAVLFSPEEETVIRSGVAISRHRGAAYPQRLFFTETTGAGKSQWMAACEGDFSDAPTAKAVAALMALAARWGVAIGGGQTQGLGWIEQVHVKATLNETEIPEQELQHFWQAWKEGRDVAEN